MFNYYRAESLYFYFLLLHCPQLLSNYWFILLSCLLILFKYKKQHINTVEWKERTCFKWGCFPKTAGNKRSSMSLFELLMTVQVRIWMWAYSGRTFVSLFTERKEDTPCTESHHAAICQRDHGDVSQGLEEAIHLVVLRFQSTEITCQQLGQLFQTVIWRYKTEKDHPYLCM